MLARPTLAILLAVLPGVARADLLVDGGLVVRRPAALVTGLSAGVAATVLRGDTFAWGGRVGWSSATEYTLTWAVRHDDLRLSALGAWQHTAGRGTVSLRAGLGAVAVREERTREQGERAGLEGDELQAVEWALLPAADLEGAVLLRIAGAWSLALSGGASLTLFDGDARLGWTGGLGVAWRH